MKYAALFAQVAMLTLCWSSNRADAMAAAAIFAVLCVVVVLLKSTKFEDRAFLTHEVAQGLADLICLLRVSA